MALATSYLEGNDYSVLKRTPYRLAVNDIAKTLAIKSEYWRIGAERVKARYLQAAGLDPSRDDNKEILKNYISQSESLIKKLSTQELGNPDIQEQGINIFKNLFQDEDLMYDVEYTKHIKKVKSDYYELLKKDPSKANLINLGYALEEERAFLKDPNRSSAKEYYSRRREYIPFYDATNDIELALKYCKNYGTSSTGNITPIANKVKNEKGEEVDVVSGYKREVSQKELTPAQSAACFRATLSEQAKQQFRISGYMAFRNNKDALASLIGKNNLIAIKGFHENILKLQEEKAELLPKKDQANVASQIEAIDKLIKETESQIIGLNSQNKSFEKGDFSSLDKNFEEYAGLALMNLKASEFGTAFSFKDFVNKIINDDVGMMILEEQYNTEDREDRQKHEKDMETMKQRGERLKNIVAPPGTIVDEDGNLLISGSEEPLKPISGDANTINNRNAALVDIETYQGRLKEGHDFIANVFLKDENFNTTIGESVVSDNLLPENLKNQNLTYNDIIEKYQNGELSDRDLFDFPALVKYAQKTANIGKTPEDIQNNVLRHTYGSSYEDWLEIVQSNTLALSTVEEYVNTNESKIDDGLKDPSKNPELLAAKGILIDGERFTAVEVAKMLEGSSVRGVKIINTPEIVSTPPGVDGGAGSVKNVNIYKIHVPGKKVRTIYSAQNRDLYDIFTNISNLDKDRRDAINKRRKELYSDKGWKDNSFFSIDVGSKDPRVTNVTTLLDGVLNKYDVSKGQKAVVRSTNFRGGIRVQLPNLKGGVRGVADKIKNTLGGITSTDPVLGMKITHIKDDIWEIQGLPQWDYSEEFKLDKASFEMGMNLSATARNLKVGEERTVSVNIALLPDKAHQIHISKTPTGVKYKLVDGTKLLLEQSNPFGLMQQILNIQAFSR